MGQWISIPQNILEDSIEHTLKLSSMRAEKAEDGRRVHSKSHLFTAILVGINSLPLQFFHVANQNILPLASEKAHRQKHAATSR